MFVMFSLDVCCVTGIFIKENILPCAAVKVLGIKNGVQETKVRQLNIKN